MYTISQSKTCDEFPHAGVCSLHRILKTSNFCEYSCGHWPSVFPFFMKQLSAERPHFTHCFHKI